MRIIELRLKNLNSLKGEWYIDFRNDAFINEGIFAITGQTGAGKTTILDAICLALYGSTPRIDSISQNTNEVMTRQTADCYAEVVINLNGHCYRCRWGQRRAHGNPNGRLQSITHEVAKIDRSSFSDNNAPKTGDKILECTSKKAKAKIIELTRMDLTQFTRSVLLAQGSFSAFLKSSSDERANILEQITGTDIYTQISINTQKKQSSENESLNQLKAGLDGLHLLDLETEQQLTEERKHHNHALAEKQKSIAKLDAQIKWLGDVTTLSTQLAEYQAKFHHAELENNQFEDKALCLDRAKKALEIESPFNILVTQRHTLKQLTANINHISQQQLPAAKLNIEKSLAKLSELESVKIEANKTLNTTLPIIQNVRRLDTELTLCNNSLNDWRKRQKALNTSIKLLQNEMTDYYQYLPIQQTHDTLARTILTHVNRKHSELSTLEKQQSALLQGNTLREIRKQQANRDQAVASLDEINKQIQKIEESNSEIRNTKSCLSQTLDSIANTKQGIRVTEDKLIPLRKAQQDKQEKLDLLIQISELQDHIALLKEDKPCPLCGATEHPYIDNLNTIGHHPLLKAEGNNQAQSPIVLIQHELETISNKILATEKTLHKYSLDVATLQQNASHQTDNIKRFKQQALLICDHIFKLLAVLSANFKNVINHELVVYLKTNLTTVTEKLQQIIPESAENSAQFKTIDSISSVSQSAISNISNALELLSKQKQAFNTSLDTYDNLTQQIETTRHELAVLEEISAKQKQVAEKQTELNDVMERITQLAQQLDTSKSKRISLFGNRNIENEEDRLRNNLEIANANHRAEQERFYETKQSVHQLDASLKTLNKQLNQETNELAEQESKFTQLLAEYNFTDEPDFRKAAIPKESRETLEKQQIQLSQALEMARSLVDNTQKQLARQQILQLTTEDKTTLASQHKKAQDDIHKLSETIGAINQQLQANEQRKEEQQKKLKVIAKQQEKLQVWDNLYKLIGASDGKKFRNFAQGLTFDIMVSHANIQLKKMSDRYLLTHDTAKPLELMVIDTYQGDEVRSTKNLSGGEGFIISLALALGLSKMASHNIGVDSLFLDEGFGTLDEESLDTALDTLANLQQEGKLIGVISHVPALKERIHTQIKVEKLSGGYSRLTGAGCFHITAKK